MFPAAGAQRKGRPLSADKPDSAEEVEVSDEMIAAGAKAVREANYLVPADAETVALTVTGSVHAFE